MVSPAYKTATFVFNYNAVIMNDIFSVFFNLPIADKIGKKVEFANNILGTAAEISASGIMSVGINVLTKILGFSFNTNLEIPLLEYEYSQHPYINRAMLTYAAIKQDCEFTIGVNAVVTSLNPFLTKPAIMQSYIKGLEYYCDRGGTFSILTASGVITPCVLQSFVALEGEAAGSRYEMTLRKINIASSGSLQKTLGDVIARYIGGGIV